MTKKEFEELFNSMRDDITFSFSVLKARSRMHNFVNKLEYAIMQSNKQKVLPKPEKPEVYRPKHKAGCPNGTGFYSKKDPCRWCESQG